MTQETLENNVPLEDQRTALNNNALDALSKGDASDQALAGNITLQNVTLDNDKVLALEASSSVATTLGTITSPSGIITSIVAVGNDTKLAIPSNLIIESTALSNSGFVVTPTNAAYTGNSMQIQSTRSASSAFRLSEWYASGDLKTKFSGDGNNTCDGSWTGGGADYAEYFEWADGNINDEDRVGCSVALVNDKIKIAESGDDILGVISGNPSVVGDGDIDWKKKYLTDDFGRKVLEDYQVVEWTEIIKDADDEETKKHSYDTDKIPDGLVVPEGATYIDMVGKDGRPKLNTDYDQGLEYVSREERNEWDMVGLLGKLRVKNDQEIDPSWKKMRDISDTVSEYFLK